MLSRSQEPDTLGEKLRKKREVLGLSIEDLGHSAQISSKYIRALEEDDYDAFSAKVYAQGTLKKLLDKISYEDKERALSEFAGELDIRTFRKPKEVTPLPENRGDSPYLTPARVALGFGAVFFVAFLIFLGFRLTNFVGSPELNIFEPAKDSVINSPVVRVRGDARKESLLTVNGREIKIDADGNFNEMIEVAAGLNSLEFIVHDRFGKTSKEVRYILVK